MRNDEDKEICTAEGERGRRKKERWGMGRRYDGEGKKR